MMAEEEEEEEAGGDHFHYTVLSLITQRLRLSDDEDDASYDDVSSQMNAS